MAFKIAIDAGHGNNTKGKRSPDGTLREFHFNNPTAQLVGKILKERYRDVTVVHPYDTTGKIDTPLYQRTRAANNARVDAFVSVHANAYGEGGWNNANGIETFIYPTASNQAFVLAANVQNEMLRETGLNNRGVKRANFQVLRDTAAPAILVECGFMTNRDEARLLKSDSFRRKCAEAIAAGIAKTFKLKPKSTTFTTADREVEKMAELLETGSRALNDAVESVLKSWEGPGPDDLSKTWRSKQEKGELTTAQAIALIYLAIDRGYIKNAKGE